MLDKIIEFSIKNKLVIGLFLLALIAYGSYQLTRLPIDAVPDITNNQVQVITVAPALGAADIERLVTFPVEQANSNIPGLIEMRSFSRFGLSLVTIVFEDNVDIYWARQQVNERIRQVQAGLPAGMGEISLGPVSTGLGEIYQYVIRPAKGYEKQYGPAELRSIQDWIVRRQLLGVQGVADVSSFGGNLKQYEIAVDPSRLKAHGITISEVFAALENNNQNTGGAYIEKGATVLYIRSEGLLSGLEDIRQINIKNLENGSPLLIGDIAEVRYGSATRYGALTYNDQGEVSGAVVLMLKGENSNVVIRRVKERVEKVRKMLPEGVVLEAFLDRTKMVNNAIHTVESNLLEGALIVVFVLVLFLGNIRAGMIVASIIPLSMLFAIIMMNLFGVSGNLMSLGALDFGLIVDGAVIIVEAVMHHVMGHGRSLSLARIPQKDMDHAVQASASRMMNSAVFGQIIILVVYLPIFTLEGIEGKMFKPMAQTVIFALLGAFLLSLTYVPMMSSLALGRMPRFGMAFSYRMMARLEHWHQRALLKVMRIPKTIVASTIVLFAFSVIVLSFLGGEFIPSLEEGDFAVETRVLNGSNLHTTVESTTQAARILLQRFPEVERVVTKIGTSEIPTDPMPMNAGDMIVNLKPKKTWTSASTFDELAEKMTKELEEVPGVTLSFQYPVQMRFNELMTGAKQDVVCKIFGENMDTLAGYAKQLGSLIASVKGTRDIYVEPVTGQPQVVITYNRAAMAQYGLSIAEVNKVVNTGLAGQSAGFVYEGEKRFGLVLRLRDEQRKSLEDVANLLIPVAHGGQIPLYQVASVELKESPGQIQREDTKRRVIVGFNVRGRDVESIVKELQQKVEKGLKLSGTYTITYGGAFENLNAARKRLGIAVPVALLLIFLLLYFSFRSVRQGLLIYSAIPLSAIGGILALALRGMPFSISAGVGFIALFGVAVLNGIVLIAEFNRLRAEGLNDLKEIVRQGTKSRLRPVLMTAFVASLGFLPMALSNGAGAEVQRPLATVVIGGLLIATFLTLFVLPVLFTKFGSATPSSRAKPLIAPLLLLCLLVSHRASSQTIGLQAAIDTALKNNLNVKNERLRAEYQKKLIQSGYSVPVTMVTGEYGQINSSYYDNRISVAQSFNFPTVYAHQKSVLKEEWKQGVLQVAVKEAELRREVSQVYVGLQYLLRKQALLDRNDSLYKTFLDKAALRYAKGETNATEKAAAQVQRGHFHLQLTQLTRDLGILRLQFQLLLNTTVAYLPDDAESLPASPGMEDTAFVPAAHPLARLLEQQTQVAKLTTRLERSKLLPEFTLAYNNMSMIGAGADNRSYTPRTRFQSGQLGLGIPLFFGSQKARVDAAKTGQKLSEQQYALGLQSIRSEYLAALADYKTNKEALRYFREDMMGSVSVILRNANLQYSSGDIDYFQWLMLISQAVAIQNSYIETARNLDESLIRLNYLLSH